MPLAHSPLFSLPPYRIRCINSGTSKPESGWQTATYQLDWQIAKHQHQLSRVNIVLTIICFAIGFNWFKVTSYRLITIIICICCVHATIPVIRFGLWCLFGSTVILGHNCYSYKYLKISLRTKSIVYYTSKTAFPIFSNW